MLIPTLAITGTCAAFLLLVTISDDRSTYANAEMLASRIGIFDISPQLIAVGTVIFCLIPLPFFAYRTVRLCNRASSSRSYTTNTALLHPIAAFLFLFALTFTSDSDKHLREYATYTRVFLAYLFVMLVFSAWLGFPYRNAG